MVDDPFVSRAASGLFTRSNGQRTQGRNRRFATGNRFFVKACGRQVSTYITGGDSMPFQAWSLLLRRRLIPSLDPIRVRSELAIGGFYCFDEISLYRLAKRLFSGTQIRIDYSISSTVFAATGHLQCLARVH
jgi:hypothetical protein